VCSCIYVICWDRADLCYHYHLCLLSPPVTVWECVEEQFRVSRMLTAVTDPYLTLCTIAPFICTLRINCGFVSTVTAASCMSQPFTWHKIGWNFLIRIWKVSFLCFIIPVQYSTSNSNHLGYWQEVQEEQCKWMAGSRIYLHDTQRQEGASEIIEGRNRRCELYCTWHKKVKSWCHYRSGKTMKTSFWFMAVFRYLFTNWCTRELS